MRRAKWIVSRDRSGYYEIRRKTKAGERKLARLYDLFRQAQEGFVR